MPLRAAPSFLAPPKLSTIQLRIGEVRKLCISTTRGMMAKISGILAAALFLCTAALAQDGHFDASLNFAGAFQNQTSGNGITQSATNGANLFATFRVKFKEKHSLAFNYGRGRDSQIFQSSYDYHVVTHIGEYSVAYMFSPFKKSGFEPFALAGVGILRFSPQSTWVILPPINGVPDNVQTNLFAAKQSQPAFLYGLGVDYKLPYARWFAVRLQYRGFFYSNPDFKVTNTSNAITFFTGTKGHMAEPSIGLVFRF